jgi:hypothetical protein
MKEEVVTMTRLSRVLYERRISQSKLSRLADIGANNLNACFRKHTRFHPGYRKRIAMVLGVEESSLFDERGWPLEEETECRTNG